MISFSSNYFVSGVIALLWCALSSFIPSRGSPASDKMDYLNDGYYLLHHLFEDETKLPLLLDIKHASPEIKDFADKISKSAEDSISRLDKMQEDDPAIKFERNPLPLVERDVRASIQDEKEHQLVFGTSNAPFERALLVSQYEAASYGVNLTKVMAGQESSPKRARVLQQLSAKWSALQEQAFRLLSSI